jgi:predicted DCC family thiol-disulfide oxidoreductase YuxK
VPELTIFYDGGCPLCMKEMRHLHKADIKNTIQFVDINAHDFESNYPTINKEEANRILHGWLADGSLLLGLDVTYKAWSLVGKGGWIAVLRWPLIKPLADLGYRFFAKYRNSISWWFTGQKRCDSCQLDRKSP